MLALPEFLPGEDVVADNRLVGGDPYAGVALHDLADAVELALIHIGAELQLVVDQGDDAGDGCVPGPFSQSVDSDVNPLHSRLHRLEDVGHRQVVVVMRMEVEMEVGIPADHLLAEGAGLPGVEDAERVG
jgi:hypothetical protein